MSPVYRFVIMGEPTAKGRPRAAKRGNFISIYTPPETVAATASAKKMLMSQVRPAGLDKRLSGPLVVNVFAYFPVRASWSRKKRDSLVGQPHVIKPDFDNVGKLYCDAMNGIVYDDDSQIAAGLCVKYWTEPGRERVEIEVRELMGGLDMPDLMGAPCG